MKKERPFIRKLLKITLTFFSILLFLLLSLFFLLKSSRVQTYITQKISVFLSKEYGTVVKTGEVDISLFKGLVLNNLYVEDQQQDTLLYVGSIGVFPKRFPRSVSNLNFARITVDSLYANVYQLPDSTLNMQFLLDSLSGDSDESEESEMLVRIKQLDINHSRLKYRELNPDTVNGINYGDIALTDFNFELQDFKLHNNDFQFAFAKIAATEHSGFDLQELSFVETAMDKNGVKAKKVDLVTPHSFIGLRDVALLYKNTEAFGHFSDSVIMQLNISDSTQLIAKDINTFYDISPYGITDLALSGGWQGTLNNAMLRNFKLRAGNLLRMQTDAKINNITRFDSLKFDVELHQLRVNLTELSKLKTPDGDSALIPLPAEVVNLQQIDYKGIAAGSINNYRSMGEISSPAGALTYKITGSNDSILSHFISGQFAAKKLRLDKILGIKSAGALTMHQKFELSLSKDESMKLKTIGMIDSIIYNNYRYRQIAVYANMQDSEIDSLMISGSEPNLDFNIFGSADFTNQIPAFELTADVNHIDLYALKLYTEKYPFEMNFNVSANVLGDEIDNFLGQIVFNEPFNIKYDTIVSQLKELTVSSEIAAYTQGDEVKRYRMDSDFFNAEAMLTGSTKELVPSVMQALSAYLPAIIEPSEKTGDKQSKIELSCQIHDVSELFRFVDSTMYLAPGSQLEANFDSRLNEMGFTFHSPGFKTGEILFKNIVVSGQNNESEIDFSANAAEFRPADGFVLKHIRFLSKLYSDSLDFNLIWNNLAEKNNTKADIKGLIAFKNSQADSSTLLKTHIKPSEVMVEGNNWLLSEALIITDSTHIGIENLRFSNMQQTISVNGSVSEVPESELKIGFWGFQLNNLNPLLPEGTEIQGEMNGNFRFRELYSDFVLLSNDTIENMSVNNISMGDMFIRSDWNSNASGVNFSFYNRFGDADLGQKVQVTDSIYGTYWPGKDSISLAGNFIGFNLRTFSPLYKDYIDFKRGSQLTGNFKVFGLLSDPQVEGNLDLKITALGVNYLETDYSIDRSLGLHFNNRIVRIDTTKMFSAGGGEALLYGNINHNSFKNFNFDIALETKNFQFLNTQPVDTSYFYGTAYGSGFIYVKGSQDDLRLDINIKTDDNTAFYIPMSSSETLSEEQSFMNFTGNETKEDTATVFEREEKEKDEEKIKPDDTGGGDMTINMSLAVTPGAEIQLIMDEQTGDIIKARGKGDLQIQINPNGDFRMLGDYTIEKGDYLFTLQNFFSKHFTIKRGGTIHWTGNPEDADIDLTAVYSLPKVGIYSLLLDPALQGAKTQANCVIEMEGDLTNPAIQFGVEFPNDEYRIAQHFKALEQDEVNEQFLSLLLMGSFQPLPGLSQQAATGSPVKIGELVSNQLNRRLADITKEVDVGLNYQTGNDLTTDELAVELSTQLWDDRVTIGGNFGVGGGLRESGGDNPQTDNIVGEVEVNVKLNPKGTIQLRAYNKANDDYTYENGLYTQGIGFFWRKEFDKIRLFKKNKKEPNQMPPDSIPPFENDSAINKNEDE